MSEKRSGRSLVSRQIVVYSLALASVVFLSSCGNSFPVGKIKGKIDGASLTTPGGDPSGVTSKLDGAQLYATNCASCHGALASSPKRNRKTSQIQIALAEVPNMVAIPALQSLTKAELDAISLALSVDPATAAKNPFVCDTTAPSEGQRLQRLAKSEYVNTLRDLFTGVVSTNELSDELAQFPEELNQENPFDRGADSLNLGLVKAQAAVAAKVASLVTSSDAKLNQIFSESCLAAASVTDACLNAFLDRFGKRVYRRPLKTAERTPLINAYKIGSTRAESSAYLLRALLMSPHFLYHLEFDGTPTDGSGKFMKLSAHELASRLSYMTINSMPDAPLMAAADNGSILTDAVYDQHATRLLGLPAARTSIRRFIEVWFGLNRIRAPAYTASFKGGLNTNNINAEALEEALLFTDDVIFSGKRLGSLLTDNTAFIKSTTLAQIYGITMPNTADGRTTLPSSQRAGVLTRAARTLAGNDGTSPILRGVAVRQSLLCESLHAPDPASLPPGSLNPPPIDPKLSTRQRFEAKTSSAACTGCHGSINPIGYALENYDGLGRYRVNEQIIDGSGNIVAQHPIDAKAEIDLSLAPNPSVNGAIELSKSIAESQKFQACFATKWFSFAMRKVPSAADHCALAATYNVLSNPNATLLDAIKSSLAASEFKTKRVQP